MSAFNFAGIICSIGAAIISAQAGPTDVVCVSEAEAVQASLGHTAGWYNGDEDRIYLRDDLVSLRYTIQVGYHELVHAEDLRRGTALNGYPSFYSETHTEWDVEQYAILRTWLNGTWPENEEFPYAIPTEDDIAWMIAEGHVTEDQVTR